MAPPDDPRDAESTRLRAQVVELLGVVADLRRQVEAQQAHTVARSRVGALPSLSNPPPYSPLSNPSITTSPPAALPPDRVASVTATVSGPFGPRPSR